MPENIFEDHEWLAGFLSRMLQLRAEEGIKTQKAFNEKIGIQRALTRWKSKETTPNIRSCLSIKKAFGRSLDWIILGEEPELPAILDAALLGQTVAVVEEVLKTSKKKIPSDQKGRLIARIYEQCAGAKVNHFADMRKMVRRYLLLTD